MRIAGFFIICFSFIIAGCKNKNKIPAEIIQQKKMQAILWDMMRADQFLDDFVLNKDSILDKSAEKVKLYGKVFDIHHISKEQFSKSFSYYKSHPGLFKVIMDSLSQLKPEGPVEMPKKVILRDTLHQSLRKVPDSIIQFRKKGISLD